MNWIDQYLQYTASQESPQIFHKWCAISTIAAVLDRKVWLDRRAPDGTVYFTSYPGQLSVCLVAGAGRCKKSTSVNIAKRFMKEAGVQVFDGKITPERLLNKLGGLPGKRPVLTIVASELSAFLSKSSYNDGLIDNLIKLLDCESNPYETNKGGVVNIVDPCLTMLMATTPYSMGKSIPPQAHDTGFLSRHIFVYSDKPGSPQALNINEDDVAPDVLLAAKAIRISLVTELRRMGSLAGAFRWSASGGRWYGAYYDTYRKSPLADAEGYSQRRPEHLTRVAMCLRVARGGSLFLDAEDLELADQWLKEIEAEMPRAFAYIGQHINAEQQQRIIKVFKDAEAAAFAKGQQAAYVNGEQLYHSVIRFFGSDLELQTQMRMLIEAGIIGPLNRDPKNNKWNYVLLKEPY